MFTMEALSAQCGLKGKPVGAVGAPHGRELLPLQLRLVNQELAAGSRSHKPLPQELAPMGHSYGLSLASLPACFDTMLVAVRSAVTLPTVANTSGIVSTASNRPSGAIGKPMAWVTGRLVAM